MSEINENLSAIRENIGAAAKKSGRGAEDITLIAVTKTVEPVRIRELLALGVNRLGENKVQEFLTKYGCMEPEPEWHIIGHLQTNKVKYVIDKVSLIQSVDSVRLAEEIDRHAKRLGKVMDILAEVNIGDEDTKYGIKPDQIESFAEHLIAFTNIRLIGLMCVAPFVEHPDENRHFYEKMFNHYVDIKTFFNDNASNSNQIKYLSMGMTNDYATAIEEGANMVRIGTALFGSRIAK